MNSLIIKIMSTGDSVTSVGVINIGKSNIKLARFPKRITMFVIFYQFLDKHRGSA